MLSVNRTSIFAIIWLLLLAGTFTVNAGDSVANAGAPDAKPTFGVFTHPQPVAIEGYSRDAMEPFISPDGNYLFFNNSNSAPVTDLYYATAVDETGLTFQFQGEIGGLNSGTLTAVPSMDVNQTFYFISDRSYMETLSTVFFATFSNGSVSGVAVVPGISKQQAGWVNFDACISPDGSTLYFVDSFFGTAGQPQNASIAIATRDGDHFVRLKNSADIMRKINTHGLNYAADISKSGLEFFFTRFSGTLPAIYTATRANTSKPFGEPVKIKAITGFAEAPALSPDEKSLYYHKDVNGTFVIYRVMRP